MDQKLHQQLTQSAHQMRKDALRMSLAAGDMGAHYGGGLSLIEIMDVLYLAILNVDPKDPFNDLRDRVVFSKGHGTLALYAAMKQKGFLSYEDLDTYKTNHTFLYGHPSMNIAKGIEFSSGSLGQGLSLGVGSCLALRHRNNLSSKVYVILGDGECNEGSIWEAAVSASHFKLNNLIAVIDKNMLQYDGPTSTVLSMDNFEEKWISFGWDTVVVDGHNIEALYEAFTKPHDKPLAVIAHTVKGKGISFMENNPLWHHSKLSAKQLEEATLELEKAP